jgi:hypothetical protein
MFVQMAHIYSPDSDMQPTEQTACALMLRV